MKELEWQYSRNQQRHWVDDGERYGKDFQCLFVIRDCRRPCFIHKPEDGYDLFYKGKKIGHAKKVKDLKDKAKAWHATAEAMKNEHKQEKEKKAVPPP